jgi:hypothetical protein
LIDAIAMRPDHTPQAPRRVFLQGTVTAIAAALIARAAYPQTSAGLVATPIADKLQLIVGTGANIVVSETSDGLVRYSWPRCDLHSACSDLAARCSAL